jgi:anti-anti-sigma factor
MASLPGSGQDGVEEATSTSSRRVTDVGDVHVVSLVGELDTATAEGLTDRLIDPAGPSVVVDLSGLTFLDSSGTAALVKARRRIEQDGSQLRLALPRRNVEQVLGIVGLSGWVSDWEPVWESTPSL